jgi:hypothetical protein
LKTGTTLSREWNGATHQPSWLMTEFLWDGARYDSLSAITFPSPAPAGMGRVSSNTCTASFRQRMNLAYMGQRNNQRLGWNYLLH